MTSFCDHAASDWELYVFGALEPEEAHTMAAHLEEGCQECRVRCLEAEKLAAGLGSLAPARTPSPAVEARLRARLATDASRPALLPRPERKPRRSWSAVASRALPWAIAAGLLFAFVSVRQELNQVKGNHAQTAEPAATAKPVTVAGEPQEHASVAPEPRSSNAKVADLNHRIEALKAENDAARLEAQQAASQLADLNARVSALQEQLEQAKEAEKQSRENASTEAARVEALSTELAAQRTAPRPAQQTQSQDQQLARFFGSRTLHQVNLRGIDPEAGHATARAFYAPGVGLVVFADSLPALPSSKCYQLWTIRKGAKSIESAGLLETDNQGNGYLFTRDEAVLTQLTGLAITQEPSGGSVSARGRKLLFGAL